MKNLLMLMLSVLAVLSITACGTNMGRDSISGESRQPEADHALGGGAESGETGMNRFSDSEENLTDIYEVWAALVGYWNAAENYYIDFDMEDSHSPWFGHGIWETSYGKMGRVTSLSETGAEEITAEVLIEAEDATEIVVTRPETTLAVFIDYSGKERDGKIRVKIDGDDWRQFAFAGMTSDEAYRVYAEATE